MGDDVVLNGVKGKNGFYLPITIFLAIIAGIVMMVRVETRLSDLIEVHKIDKEKMEEKIELYRLEQTNLRIELAEVKGQLNQLAQTHTPVRR